MAEVATRRVSGSHKHYLEAGCVVSRVEVGAPFYSGGPFNEVHFYGLCRLCGKELRDIRSDGSEAVSDSPYTADYYGPADATICVACAHNQYRASIDLTGRNARCHCGKVRPSSWDLPFFEFRGEGSKDARERCALCSFATIAHDPSAEHMARVESDGRTRYDHLMDQIGKHDFTPHGGFEQDNFYCGHAGWD